MAPESELVSDFIGAVESRNPGEPEFLQAVHEVATDVLPFLESRPEYRDAKILHRLVEPERVVSFRVCWEDDRGEVHINRGYRVQFNSAIGPYKGGLRFHPSVNQSVLKFLGFEQIFKNALTGLPMGGGKGGADFDPKGRSDREVMRFCQAFMTELARHIGKDIDVPAGDIGVGAREVGFLFGQYKRIQNEFTGTMTGKAESFGGSPLRPEATGYGCVYFAAEALEVQGEGFFGARCSISGSGNVALFAAEKLIELGALVQTLSDSSGFVFDPDGIDGKKLDWVARLKNERRGRIAEFADEFGCEYYEGQTPWSVPCDLAFPCATQNELRGNDAAALIENKVRGVFEGANMPTSASAVDSLRKHRVILAPGKAANAGGVAVSGLEQSQNALRMSWSREEVDGHLRSIMKKIHARCIEWGQDREHVDYVRGANLAGFVKVADAMLRLGLV